MYLGSVSAYMGIFNRISTSYKVFVPGISQFVMPFDKEISAVSCYRDRKVLFLEASGR